MKTNRMALDLAGQFSSVDLNPVLVWGDQHRVLDVKILAPSEISPLPRRLGGEPNVEHLDAFFSPKSVALWAPHRHSTKVGGAVLESLARHGYPGRVFPINAARDEVMGLRAFPSLKDVPEPVDLVVVTVPLAAVPELIRDCAAVGTHNMVVISAGGKELGGEGERAGGHDPATRPAITTCASWAATASECSTASRISTPSSTPPSGWYGRPKAPLPSSPSPGPSGPSSSSA